MPKIRPQGQLYFKELARYDPLSLIHKRTNEGMQPHLETNLIPFLSKKEQIFLPGLCISTQGLFEINNN
jgi:hypothetical protein